MAGIKIHLAVTGSGRTETDGPLSQIDRGCVKTHFGRRVGLLTGEFDVTSRLKLLYLAEINARKWGAYVFTQPRPEAVAAFDLSATEDSLYSRHSEPLQWCIGQPIDLKARLAGRRLSHCWFP